MTQATLALIGCSKSKRHTLPGEFVKARDLYTGDLFRRRVEYAETRGIAWVVLSGSGALLCPNAPVRNYDRTLADMTAIERASWHAEICYQVIDQVEQMGCHRPSDATIQLHAGRLYCEPLQQLLEALGVSVVRPLQGLGIGKQKSYYLDQALAYARGDR